MQTIHILKYLGGNKHKYNFSKYLLMVVVFLIVIALTIIVTLHRDELQKIAGYGYLGIFLACLVANSTVFLPSPSTAIVFAFSSILCPFWVAIAGGLGAALGEVVGYFLGFTRYQLNKNSRIQGWMDKYGMLTILLFAFLPLPLFDIVGFLAGRSGVRLYRFILPTIVGKVLKMSVYALLGAKMIPILAPYIQRLFSEILVFIFLIMPN